MDKDLVITNNARKGGYFKGKSHAQGGMKAIIVDNGNKPIEVESEEVIINKKSVNSNKKLRLEGTPKEILSTINQMEGNGVAIGDSEAQVFGYGGLIENNNWGLGFLKWWNG